MRWTWCFGTVMLLWVLGPGNAVAQATRTVEEQRAYLEKLWSQLSPSERRSLSADLKERQRRIEIQAAKLEREASEIKRKLNRPAPIHFQAMSSNYKLLGRLGEKQSELGELSKSLRSVQSSLLAFSHLTLASIRERQEVQDRAILQLQIESISVVTHPSYLMCADDILDKARLDYWEADIGRFAKQFVAMGDSVGKVQCSRRSDASTETCTESVPDSAKWKYSNVGTAFVVRSDLMVTNRHVAEQFATLREGIRWSMRPGVIARVEFPALYSGCVAPRPEVTKTVSEVFIHPTEDIAVLRFKEGELPGVLGLRSVAQYQGPIALIGYPERDYKVPRAIQESVFRGPKGDVPFGVRRIQPGDVTLQEQSQRWRTDASALNGNSGSPIVQLGDGTVVGIHVGGYPGGENLFIGAAEIIRLLQLVP